MSYISIKSAVERTGKSASTITRWCKQYERTVHVKRQGKKFVICKTFLNKLMAGKKTIGPDLVTNQEKAPLIVNSEELPLKGIPLRDSLENKPQKPKSDSSVQCSLNQCRVENINLKAQNKQLLLLKTLNDESQQQLIKSLEEKIEFLTNQLELKNQQAESLKRQLANLDNQMQEKKDEEVNQISNFFTGSFDKIQSVLSHQTRLLNALRTEQEQTFQLLPIPLKQEAIKVTPAVDGEGFTIEDHKIMKLLLAVALVLVFIHYIKGHIFIPFSIPYWQETRGIRLLLVSIITSCWCIKVWKHFKSEFRKAWRIFLFFWKV